MTGIFDSAFLLPQFHPSYILIADIILRIDLESTAMVCFPSRSPRRRIVGIVSLPSLEATLSSIRLVNVSIEALKVDSIISFGTMTPYLLNVYIMSFSRALPVMMLIISSLVFILSFF